jgi:hypothetical protein
MLCFGPLLPHFNTLLKLFFLINDEIHFNELFFFQNFRPFFSAPYCPCEDKHHHFSTMTLFVFLDVVARIDMRRQKRHIRMKRRRRRFVQTIRFTSQKLIFCQHWKGSAFSEMSV